MPAQFNAFMERTKAFMADQTEFKDCPARPVVASVRSDHEVDEDIQSGLWAGTRSPSSRWRASGYILESA